MSSQAAHKIGQPELRDFFGAAACSRVIEEKVSRHSTPAA